MKLKHPNKIKQGSKQKLYVAQIKTELIVAAYDEDGALDAVNLYLEDSIENYTGDDKMARKGWGFHLNELVDLKQLQDPENADTIAYDDISSKDVREHFKSE